MADSSDEIWNSDFAYDELEAEMDRLREQLSTQMEIAEGGWAVAKKQIAAQLKIARMNMKLQLKQMKEIGIPMRELAQRAQAFDEEQAKWLRGFSQAQLGLEYAKYSASLSGPENWMQAYNFARNAQANPNVPVYMQNLLEHTQAAGFSGYAGAPDPLTAQSIQSKLAGGGAYAATDAASQEAAAIAAAGQIFNRGPGQLAPGSLENLDEHELATLASIGGGLGHDVPRWLRDYQRSKLGQESALAA